MKCFEYKMTGELIEHTKELEGWITTHTSIDKWTGEYDEEYCYSCQKVR